MKSFAIFFCLSALAAVGKAQYPCSLQVAVSFSIPGVAADNSPDLSNSLVPSDISPQVPSDNSLQVPSDITGVSDSVLDDAISQSYENTMDYIRARSVGLLLSKRQDFSCSGDETCYKVSTVVFCANAAGRTGEFHAPGGASGNLNTGAYTLADGRTGNVNEGPIPTLYSDASPGAVTAPPSAATDQTRTPTQTAARSDPEPSDTASFAPNAPAFTTRASSTRTTPTPVALFNNGASSLAFPSTVLMAFISVVAGSFLWRSFFC